MNSDYFCLLPFLTSFTPITSYYSLFQIYVLLPTEFSQGWLNFSTPPRSSPIVLPTQPYVFFFCAWSICIDL